MTAFTSGVVLAQLIGLAPGGVTGELSVANRTEARYRPLTRQAAVADQRSVADLETLLAANLTLRDRRSELSFGYSPRFSYLDVFGNRNLALFHTGSVSTGYTNRQFSLSFSLAGSAGSQSTLGTFAGLVRPAEVPEPDAVEGEQPAAPPPPENAELPQTFYPGTQILVITTASATAALGMGYAFSRQWSATLGLGYQSSGGVDFASQTIVRPNHGPQADLGVTYALTRQDRLTTQITPSYTIALETPVFDRATFFNVNITEGWSRVWSERLDTSVSAGIAYSRADDSVNDTNNSINGAGGADLNYTKPLREGTLGFGFSARLSTGYNRFIGTAQSLATAAVSATWTQDPFTVVATTSAATSVAAPEAQESRALAAGVTAGYNPVEAVQLQIGARANAQVLPADLGGFQDPVWAAFVAVQLLAPSIRF